VSATAPRLAFAGALPPDVPVPPAEPEGGVRWPDGVVRPPGERPPAADVPDATAAGHGAGLTGRRRMLIAAVALGAAALAFQAVRRRRR
jgi:hypothetical protein